MRPDYDVMRASTSRGLASASEKASSAAPTRVALSRRAEVWSRTFSRDSGADRLTDADRRTLSPLFWSHANLYGTIQIDMDTHLGLAA
ncbi:hypothetical protein J2853_001393 [Streptosporangium lutulentum]|uniref:Tn3 transposase DDE domain-containing protein n=1 Tax=Streptosporangium lutulentum TaxID=1461250 RepID=A0ABT9Q6A4_9ACTN|nr:hypothetical protein [Streptosporangium lutulentum]MDP9842182.1 hypothetical protein [Streptosporangium lutulentum]